VNIKGKVETTYIVGWLPRQAHRRISCTLPRSRSIQHLLCIVLVSARSFHSLIPGPPAPRSRLFRPRSLVSSWLLGQLSPVFAHPYIHPFSSEPSQGRQAGLQLQHYQDVGGTMAGPPTATPSAAAPSGAAGGAGGKPVGAGGPGANAQNYVIYANRTAMNEASAKYYAAALSGLLAIFIIFHLARVASTKLGIACKSPGVSTPFLYISR
jgi:hypothetical protein